MPTQITNKFTSFEFAPEEKAAACQFSTLQRCFIQNEIAALADEKIALTFNPQNPTAFAQQEAELAGKIGVLEYLLAAAEFYAPTSISHPVIDLNGER